MELTGYGIGNNDMGGDVVITIDVDNQKINGVEFDTFIKKIRIKRLGGDWDDIYSSIKSNYKILTNREKERKTRDKYRRDINLYSGVR